VNNTKHSNGHGNVWNRRKVGSFIIVELVLREPFHKGSEHLACGKHVIGGWLKHTYSTLPPQQLSILTDWLPGLMESREVRQERHGLRLWRHFDFANRIPWFFWSFIAPMVH
jgi:hypothetical protein